MSKFRTSDTFKIWLKALLAFSALFSFACSSAAPPRQASSSAEAMPPTNEKEISDALDVPLTKLDGAVLKLADFKGKVMVVDFWATNCGPCVKQAPRLAELSNRYRDRGLEIVGLTSNEKSEEKEVKEFIKKVGINYEVAYANRWVSRAFLTGTEDATGAPPIPQLFVISRDGRVVEHLIGEHPERGLPYLEKIVTRELALNTTPQ